MSETIPGQLTRQELYDRIRETSKDEYILAEMKRLGFWDQNAQQPHVSEQVIVRKGELNRELSELYKQKRIFSDPEKALKELREQRMQAAREKREETKRKRTDARHQRALNWHKKQQTDIAWLGEGVSAGLNETEANNERLQAQDLPLLKNAQILAETMGISLGELRFLAYNRKISKISHYQRFDILKKTGGIRQISAPMPRLKRAQYWVLDNILQKPELHDAAHGFIPGRSIVSNAQPHVGQAVVINLDLQNFFPTISYRRIKGLFQSLGYNEAIATVLALLCSEPETDEIELDNELWYAANGERHLPQGAPTSPAISNLITRALDRRMQGIADKLGFRYSRYADDMTFSGNKVAVEHLTKLFWHIRRIVKDEGFTLHPDKTRIMRAGSRQEVTGIVVNDQLSLDRKVLKRFRTLLFQIEKDGLEGKHWNGVSGRPLLRSMQGYANYVVMVNREKGLPLKRRVDAISPKSHTMAIPQSKTGAVSRADFRQRSAAGLAPWKGWWEPAVKAAPVREDTPAEMNERKKREALQLRIATQENEIEVTDDHPQNPMQSALELLETSLSESNSTKDRVLSTLLRKFFR